MPAQYSRYSWGTKKQRMRRGTVSARNRLFIYCFQSTLLHIASARGRWRVVQVLLAWGADIMAIDFGGMRRTALHWACHGGHIKTVEILREHGADVSL